MAVDTMAFSELRKNSWKKDLVLSIEQCAEDVGQTRGTEAARKSWPREVSQKVTVQMQTCVP